MKALKVVLFVVAIVFATSSTAEAILGPIPLVSNGGFETGDWDGWIRSGNLDGTSVDSLDVHSGSYAASFGPATEENIIGQDIATTAGQTYEVDFWLKNTGEGSGSAMFVARWDQDQKVIITDPTSFGWTKYSYTAVATWNDYTPIEFRFSNESGYWELDDVSARVVPIPGAIWLFGSGLIGLVGIGRKFKK